MTDETEARELEAMTRGRDQALDLANRRHGEAIRAAERERAAIVTWLRDGDDEASERLCDALREEIWRQRNRTDKSPNGVFAAQPYFDLFAEAIRRGDHMKEREG